MKVTSKKKNSKNKEKNFKKKLKIFQTKKMPITLIKKNKKKNN